MSKQIAIIGVVGLACLAGGFLLGKITSSQSAPSRSGEASSQIRGNDSLLYPESGGASSTPKGSETANGTGSKAKPQQLLSTINNANGKAAVASFYQMLGSMSSDQIAELMVDVDKFPNHSRRRETREMIIDYLTKSDPKKALEIREQLPGNGIFRKAYTQLGRTDPFAAIKMHDEIEDVSEKSEALLAIFVGASEIDPSRAFDLLKTTEGVGPQHYHEVFDNWAELDPTTAARMALTVTEPAKRREALKIVGQEWAERDPQAVLDWVADTKLSAYEREVIRGSALDAYSRRDPKAALEFIAGLDSTVRNRVLPNTINELIKDDPDAAIQWMRDEPDGFAKLRAINESSWRLANKAPLETIELAREIPALKENGLSSAFRQLAQDDLALALESMKAWEGDPSYGSIISSVASGYASENPEEALKWALSVDDQHRSNVISNVISNMAGNDPDLAVGALEQLGLAADDPTYQNAVSNIASNWAYRDPFSAAEWLESVPDSNARNNALASVADRWARIDPVSASEWIAGLPEGTTRDQSAQRLIRRITNEDPEMAAYWAQSLSDENARNSSMQQVYSSWMRVDPAGAQSSIESSGLPDEMKQRLLGRGNPPAESHFRGGISVETPGISIR